MALSRKTLAGGIAAVALAAAIGAGAAFAQTPPSGTPTKPQQSAQQRAQDFLNALAAKLGKTPDEIKNAFKSVEHDRVNQALKDGKLTQQQADRMNSRIDQAPGVPFGPGLLGPKMQGHGGRPGVKPGAGPPAFGAERGALAGFLGVTPQQLGEALKSGKSLAQFAQEKGKDRSALKTFLTNQAKARFDQAVKNGKLTQVQADQMLQRITSGLDQMIDRTFTPGQRKSQGAPRRGGFGFGEARA